jgi:A/G-specific adenine glycosylase
VPQTAARRKTNRPKAKPKAERLLAWYDRHRRVLPWRALPGEKPDPYRVWLSEIMLQQTTVATVGPYFAAFLKQWPTVQDLARATLDEVRVAWAGLGYYRRAEALWRAAQQVAAAGGVFPQTEAELQCLPGIGPYTSAAIAAIAFDRRANVVDGNVERVVARLFSLRTPLPKAKPELRALAENLLPTARFADYAQAMMDLGATVCTPRRPACATCPFSGACRAEAEGIVETLPAREAPRAKPVRRAIAFVAVGDQGALWLRQRPAKGLLGGMIEVPSSPWTEGPMPSLASATPHSPFPKARWRLAEGTVRHVFSHFELEVRVAIASISTKGREGWTPLDRLSGTALPSVMRKIIRHAFAQGQGEAVKKRHPVKKRHKEPRS